MRQRVMIAMALVNDPQMIIADEPTTALDVTVQAQIIDLLRDLQDDFGTAIVLITHDLGVVADMADEVLVMYGGRCVEQAKHRELFYRPQMPYTWGLLSSMPRTDVNLERLEPIPGNPPSLLNLPKGCVFRPRCPYHDQVPDGLCDTDAARPDRVRAGAPGPLPHDDRAAAADHDRQVRRSEDLVSSIDRSGDPLLKVDRPEEALPDHQGRRSSASRSAR